MRILIADDSIVSRHLLEATLRKWGYEVVVAQDGLQAWDILQGENPPRLVILDWVMPGLTGPEVCSRAREKFKNKDQDYTYIVLLSSKSQREDLIEGLEAGADDYLTKPFGMDELLARMRAALRHQLQVAGERPLFRSGGLSVDLVRRLVKVGDKEVKLSPKEYELLRVLVQHAGKVLPHRFLLTELCAELTDAQYLRGYVRQLRQKVEPDAERPQFVLTETGIGYRLRAPD